MDTLILGIKGLLEIVDCFGMFREAAIVDEVRKGSLCGAS